MSAKHAFQHRPAPAAPAAEPTESQWAHGFCYLARQARLQFGYDRYEPVEWRPVISLQRDRDSCHVLPATRKYKPTFFPLEPADCHYKKPHPNGEPPQTSYYFPRPERLSPEDMIELGVLPHPLRIRLFQWLREQQTALE